MLNCLKMEVTFLNLFGCLILIIFLGKLKLVEELHMNSHKCKFIKNHFLQFQQDNYRIIMSHIFKVNNLCLLNP